ncbi:hypothetical protein ACFFUP_12235 [Vibrio ostreicida]|uniref:Phenylacetate--CoA ligase family protein n=1 Tax=Vibrio ostreicida TaxID=526588 RepID=A0ABT8C1V8_9VIBR|nr:hypothetical protein [Vibrio ostreicida]MDN3611274.1 hypothetical protein [Vibrio ostreicida]MDN3612604.1 hypothetical protein [Vibrio ostreicida]NPD09219.1 hypothetical protein [Vibrio ostreicida]
MLFHPLKDNLFYRALIGKTLTPQCAYPILNKSDYDRAIRQLRSRFKPTDDFWRSVYWSPTGGSTSSESESLFFPWDNQETETQRRLMASALSIPSLGPFADNRIMANVFTGTQMYRSLELFNQLATYAQMTSLPIGSNCTHQQMDQLITHFSPDLIAGPPIILADYATYCLKNGLSRPKSAVLYATNPLFPAQANAIKAAFHDPVIYSVYGSAETGPWAFHNSEVLAQNQFIVVDDIADVEIIDPDPHGYGQVVVTIKPRKRFPVVRYAMGDIGKRSMLELGHQHYTLLEVKGRNSQWLSLADNNIALETFYPILEHALDWQIVQYFEEHTHKEVVHFRLVSGHHCEELHTQIEQLERVLLIDKYKGRLVLKVEQVRVDDLIKSKLSQKVIKVVDQRGDSPTDP